jgi:hypothetical protein
MCRPLDNLLPTGTSSLVHQTVHRHMSGGANSDRTRVAMFDAPAHLGFQKAHRPARGTRQSASNDETTAVGYHSKCRLSPNREGWARVIMPRRTDLQSTDAE